MSTQSTPCEYSEYSRSSPSAVPLPRRSLKPCCSRGTDLTHHSRGVQPCLGGALPRFVRSGNVSRRCCNMYILLVQHSTAHTLRGGTALQAVGGTSSTAPSAPLHFTLCIVFRSRARPSAAAHICAGTAAHSAHICAGTALRSAAMPPWVRGGGSEAAGAREGTCDGIRTSVRGT